MIEIKVTTEKQFDRVEQKAKRAGYENFRHAAASIRKEAQRSIKKRVGPSNPGEPPHTRRGQLRRAIVFQADQHSAVVGPRASVVGEAGAAHEFGQEFRGTDFPERPFMGPALDENLDRFGAGWGGSIG